MGRSKLPNGGPVRSTSPGPSRFIGNASFQLDRAFDIDGEIDPADRQFDFCGQALVSLELPLFDGRADGLLDLPLRGDADFLEEFSHAHIEHVLVHDRLLEPLLLQSSYGITSFRIVEDSSLLSSRELLW